MSIGRRLRYPRTPLILAALLGVTTGLVAWAAAEERVARIWVSATVAADGSARVHEVIDYDFAARERHGIFRDVPDLDRSVPVEISSPDAPTHLTITENADSSSHLRIGDPAGTISGLHRYDIEYTLTRLGRDGTLAWDAVGTGWDVPIDHVEVHLIAASDLTPTRCVFGTAGSSRSCTVDQTEAGHLVTSLDALGSGEGLTLYARIGAPLDRAPGEPAEPAAPSGRLGPLGFGAVIALLTLIAGLGTAWLFRRAGRDHAPATGALMSAAPGERISRKELARAVSPSPSLPDALTPAQAGVVLDGWVLDRHKAAWLTERAVAGEIAVERGSGIGQALVLVRLQPGSEVLDHAFQGRERLPLGAPDPEFRRSWGELGQILAEWSRASGLWDTDAEARATRGRPLGLLVGIVGVALAVVGAVKFAHGTDSGLVVAGIGGVVAGAGFVAGMRRGYERTLTAEGAAAWLQVEALRQFLARSGEAEIDELAPDDRSAYTPWAVALGEADHWSLVTSSAAGSGRTDRDDHATRYWPFARYGPLFVSSCATTGAPLVSAGSSSSSSRGGGGGFSVGGGGGGGGGGSW